MSRTVQLHLATATAPGAVAIIQICGGDVRTVLTEVTGRRDWRPGDLRLVAFADIDHGLAAMLRDDWAQLMPHGGPRVVARLIDMLMDLGAVVADAPASREMFPEATSEIEADMLSALSRAASPAAIDLLLAQPGAWRDLIVVGGNVDAAAVLERSRILERLLHPPTIVVVGQANVGKSTLTNRMLGRSASVVADLPGTTRDWVAGLAEIRGVAVTWLDTPGLRHSEDMIEQQAIQLARQAVANADLLIAMRSPEIGWPEASRLARSPDLWVMNQCDRLPDAAVASDEATSPQHPMPISAREGTHVDALEAAILKKLSLWDHLGVERASGPWAFSRTLYVAMEDGDKIAIARYISAFDQPM